MNQANGACAWACVQWTVDPTAHLDRAGHTATAVGSNIWIAFGGNGGMFYTDVLVFDTSTARLTRPVGKLPSGVRARSNHTATLIGTRLWFIAGNDTDEVFGDVITLDTATNTWQVVKVNDPHELLARTAHAAEVHPRLPHNILLMGGYGPMQDSNDDEYDMHNDLVMLDTQNRSTERLAVFHGCVPPTPRAWHTMSAVGDRLYIFGGRNSSGIVTGSDPSLLVVYDVVANHWLRPVASGVTPTPRSSHRAVVLGNRIVLYGGASAGGDSRNKERMNDVHSLVIRPDGQLVWSTCDTPQGGLVPQGRSAHTMTLVGNIAYVICGYNGSKGGSGSSKGGEKSADKHACDCWALSLLPDAFERATGAAAAVLPGGAAAADAPPAAAAGSKRGAAAAARAAANGGGGGDAAGGGEASGWHTAKRQRSGGSGSGGGQQPPPPQQQRQQQQQQQQLAARNDPAIKAAMAAAAAAVGSALRPCSPVRAPGACSPLACQPGSPLQDIHDAYTMVANGYLPQQQDEGLRQQVQDLKTRNTTLEAELRLLQQHLAEAKADARQDRALADSRLQEMVAARDEAARQRAMAEQSTVRLNRMQEEATVAQQDLSTAKQQQQSLQAEVRKLRTQHADTDKELQQARLQLQQLQQGERRLQEQLAQERQQLHSDSAQTRACMEQHRKELQRLNDTMADERQKHAAAVQQHQQQEAAQAQLLQEKVQRVQELQRQLEEAQAAANDARKQKEAAVALQASTREQLQQLNNSCKGTLQEKERLATELGKAKEEADRARHELEQERAASRGRQAAFAQLQAAMHTMTTAMGQGVR